MEKNKSAQIIQRLKKGFVIKSSILIILITAIAIFATLIAYQVPWIYDMTADKIFTLSDQTKQVLSSLPNPIEIIAIYPKDGADPMISSLLAEYVKAGGEKLSVEYVDAERDPTKLASYNFGLSAYTNGTLIVRSLANFKVLNATEMFQSSNEGNSFWGEREFTGAIRYVTAATMPVVYFLEGHEEASISSQISKASNALELDVYKVKSLSLVKEQKVPADASLVIIPSPKKDLDDVEYAALRDYLNAGGKAMFLIDPLNTNAVILANINKVLNDFNIEVRNNIVVEEDTSSYLSTNKLYLIPGYAYHTITQQLAESKRYVILPIAMGWLVIDIKNDAITQEPLLASTPKSWMRTDLSIAITSKSDSDVQGPIPLAYAVTKVGDSGKSISRIVVVGNSTFIYDDNIEAYANRDFFLNCVNWLIGDRGTGSIAPRIIGANRLIVRGNDFTKLVIICVVVLPMIPFIGAFLIWLKRRNQ